jgi:hypothetical protein
LHHNRSAREARRRNIRRQLMAKAKGKKGSVKVQDMRAKKNPKGGYQTIKLSDATITSAATQKVAPTGLDSTWKLNSSSLKIK